MTSISNNPQVLKYLPCSRSCGVFELGHKAQRTRTGRSHDGRAFRTLNIIDEFTKEALAIRVKRRLNSTDVVDALTDLFILRGPPRFIRSDNGKEFVAEKVCAWIGAVGAKTAFIEPGSPWENGSCESFNSRFRHELSNGEVFYSTREAHARSSC